MKKYKYIFTLLVIYFYSLNASAQAPEADFLRSTGKIYSVITAIVIIFLLLALYLYRLDRKISKLENTIRDEHKTS
jgi:CcmD family protein